MNRGNPLLTEIFPNSLHTYEFDIEEIHRFINVLYYYKKYHDIRVQLTRPFVNGFRIFFSGSNYKFLALFKITFNFKEGNKSYKISFDILATESYYKVISKSYLHNTIVDRNLYPVIFYQASTVNILFLDLLNNLGAVHDYGSGISTSYLTNGHVRDNVLPFVFNNKINDTFRSNNYVHLRAIFLYSDKDIVNIAPIRNYNNNNIPADGTSVKNISIINSTTLGASNIPKNVEYVPLKFSSQLASYKSIFYVNAVSSNVNADSYSLFGGPIVFCSNVNSENGKQRIHIKKRGIYIVEETNYNLSSSTGIPSLCVFGFLFSNLASQISYTLPVTKTNNLKSSGIIFRKENDSFMVATSFIPGEFCGGAWDDQNYANNISVSRSYFSYNKTSGVINFPLLSIDYIHDSIIIYPGSSVHWPTRYDFQNKIMAANPVAFKPMIAKEYSSGGLNKRHFIHFLVNNDSDDYETAKFSELCIEAPKIALTKSNIQIGALNFAQTASQASGQPELTPISHFTFFVTSS